MFRIVCTIHVLERIHMRAKQVITYIKQNTEAAELPTMTKEQVVNILEELKNEIGILTDRHDAIDRAECLTGLVTSST